MSKRIDLTGQKFGRLTVTGYSHTKNKNSYWHCVCECGNRVIVCCSSLKRGLTKSCGCLQREITRKRSLVHGQKHSRLYRIWGNMKQRCFNPSEKQFKNYGGRGITVCDEWKTDFQAFYDWAIANGYREDLTIDRIDVNGGYNSPNCRWVTKQEQHYNRRDNHFLTFEGRTMPMKKWSEEVGISYHALHGRINRCGWSVERALTTPPRPLKKEK